MSADSNQNFQTATSMAAILAVLSVFSIARAAAQETILLNYNGSNGGSPAVTMAADKAGNLYGTTVTGGADPVGCYGTGCGTVFELVNSGGKYTYRIIHSFFANGSDGEVPNAQLIVDSHGNLYGDTYQGGTNGLGTVFTMRRNSAGVWGERVIYNFTGGADGANPEGALAFDSVGNLYGTASAGGIMSSTCSTFFGGCGTVFKLTPHANGKWSETTLYQFQGTPDGWFPLGGVVVSANGSLYGTTEFGGSSSNCTLGLSCGTVYSLTWTKGGWLETILHSFNQDGIDGFFPVAGLTADSSGNLYGTTMNGGSTLSGCSGSGCGVVFELVAPNWTEKILYSFNGGNDGGGPDASLTFDQDGNIYSTGAVGGTGTACGFGGCGVVFELRPRGTGSWAEATLHDFGMDLDGYSPFGGVIFGVDGNLYGTTYSGGTNGIGIVYKLVP